MKLAFFLALTLALALAAYIRVAPSDVRRWHGALTAPQGLGVGAVLAGRDHAWVIVPAPITLQQLDALAMATPRTTRLAGSVGEGRITWVTRSGLWGFPDYTTAQVVAQGVVKYARARFGRGDMGVNAARLRAWLERLS